MPTLLHGHPIKHSARVWWVPLLRYHVHWPCDSGHMIPLQPLGCVQRCSSCCCPFQLGKVSLWFPLYPADFYSSLQLLFQVSRSFLHKYLFWLQIGPCKLPVSPVGGMFWVGRSRKSSKEIKGKKSCALTAQRATKLKMNGGKRTPLSTPRRKMMCWRRKQKRQS